SRVKGHLLFSEYAPINPELTEFLKEFIILKKAINSRTENSFVGKELFALQEAQRLLDESNTKISPQQSQQIFIRGVLKPTNEIITDKRALGLQSNQTFGEARSISDQWETNYRAYLQGLWNEFTTNQQQLESFQRFAQFEIAPLAVPQQEFVIYLQSAQAGADYPLFETGQERVLSPLAGMSDFSNKAQQFGQINRLAQGLGRGLLNRFGGKAAEKGVEEAVGKIAGGLAEKAGSTLPGGPITGKALGWLAKNATTKEGRKKILLVAGGGLGSILLPLATWGGRIGMAIGGGLGAVVGSIFPGVGNVVGGVIGGIGGGWAGMRISNGFKNLFGGGGGETASIGFQSPGIDSRTLTTGSAITSKGTSAAGSAVATAMTNTASQAVLTTLGVVGSVFLFTSMNFTGAFLAEFPQIDPLGTIVPGTQGKVSDYVTIEKRVFITGCPENKCKNPSFPIKAEYSIIIRPKANYGIAVSEVIDSLKVNHSKKAWEEEGKSPPDIPERIKGLDDISELYSGLVISPGEEFAFSYTETFDENYNHAIVLNTFELKFSFRDAATGEEGEDNAITGEVVYIGNYSQGAGCWPTSGSITQLPGGSWSHKSADAFDIANSEGTPVYAPFSGNLCVGGMDSAYGNHLILEAGEGRFLFGHFSRMIIGSGCQSIESGELIGNMGNTGRSTGPHLHFELLGGNIRPSSLGSLMPDGLATKENDPVRTCYDVN
ncbi:MAG: M23 family metallopeptidase, partial [Candidatus Paceibacterota bacterium]